MHKKPSRVLLVLVLAFAGSAYAAGVHVPDGTSIPLRLKADLSSTRASVGDRVDFAVAHPVSVGGVVAIPEGCVAWGAVQSVKRDKEIKFDVQGLRLPNLREIKLRSVRQKTSNPGKDQIKLETKLGDTVGAGVGTEFSAYVDEDVEVDAAGVSAPMPASITAASRPAEAKPASQAPAPGPVVTPRPAESAPGPTRREAATAVSTPAPSPATATPVQASQPPAPAPKTTPAQPTTAAPAPDQGATAERVTVECFSDPSGAEISINDEYYGNTPSILKLLPITLRVDLKMPGYKTDSRSLDLAGASGLRTIRGVLEKKE